MNDEPEYASAVRLFVAARRHARFWLAAGNEDIAARMRVQARRQISYARYRKAHPTKAPT